MRVLLLKTVRDLKAARSQTTALAIIVALGLASFVTLVGAYRDLSSSYNRTYERLHFADVEFNVDAAPESALEDVGRTSGVAAVTGRLIVDTGFELPDGERIRSRLIGIHAEEHPNVNDLLIQEGRFLSASDDKSALLESHFAATYGLHPGDTITPIVEGQKTSFRVVGVVASPEYLIVSRSRQEVIPSARTFAVLFVPLPVLQSLVGARGQVNDFAVRLKPGADRNRVIGSIQAKLKPFGLTATTLQADQASNAGLRADLDGYQELAYLMPGLILLVAAISVYVTLGRLVRSQQPQIGLMKALGYGDVAIAEHYLTFALSIAVLGSIAGLLFGIPLARLITGAYAAELGIPLVQTRFYPDLVGVGVLITLIVSAIAGLGPSLSSSRVSPALAMRLDPSLSLVRGRPSPLERLVRPPLWLQMALRSVFRLPRRSITTALGIIFAYALVLMSWGMFDSMANLLHQNFQVIERWDLVASFQSLQHENVLSTVRGWKGVEVAEPTITLPATIKGKGKDEDVLLTGLSPSQRMHNLQLSINSTPEQALSKGHIVLTTALIKKLNLKPGDTVPLGTMAGLREFTLSGGTEEMAGAAAYVSLEDAENIVGTPVPAFNGLYLKVDPSQAKAIEAELYQLPDASNVQLKDDIRRDWGALLSLFYVFMGVVLAFALATAFALLFNAMTVNVLERQREFATMRALGAGGGQITVLLTAESLVLWALTVVPGLLLGWWVAMQMGAAFSSELIAFSIVIYSTSYAIAALGILATMILASLPAIRRVNHLNLAEATKVLT